MWLKNKLKKTVTCQDGGLWKRLPLNVFAPKYEVQKRLKYLQDT